MLSPTTLKPYQSGVSWSGGTLADTAVGGHSGVEVGKTPVSGELSVEAGRKPLVSGLSGVEAGGTPFSGEYGGEVGDCAVSEDSGIEAGGN